MSDDAPRTFEQALSELEDHVRRLDSGELPLDDSLEVFESGVKLVRECQELLDGAEQRITELTSEGTNSSDASQGG
jgi:exodeoxyribonuclease VII small subunit